MSVINLFFCATQAFALEARQQLIFASSEKEPYIGVNLPSGGYVHELVSTVFDQAGYDIEIKYYPPLRARLTASSGTVDGLLPAYQGKTLQQDFLLSNSFPGDQIGLLKKKTSGLPDATLYAKNLQQILHSLQDYKFSQVRATSDILSLDPNLPSNRIIVNKDIQSLDVLDRDRVDFAIIDKFTAADLMVEKRPHLIGQLEFLQPPLVSNDFHVAFSTKVSGYQQVQQDFNRSLQVIKQDGTLDRLLYKHGLTTRQNPSQNKVTLTIGTVDNRDMIVMRRLSKIYQQENPAVQLEWRVLEEKTLRRRLMSDLAISDGQFDIMTIGAFEAPIWAKNGWLSALDNLPESYDLDDVLAPVREVLSYQGQPYAMPFYSESSMTFYRKDLFQQAGIVMPENPTYDQIEKFSAAIHNPAENIYGICLRGEPGWGANLTILGTMINAFGGRWFDQQWKAQINTSEWKAAVTTYKNLLTRFGPPDSISNNFNENLALFSNGHCGIWIDATVAAGLLFNPHLSKVHDRLGFAAAPTATTAKGSHWLWIWALAIPDSSKHKQQALDFISWATSKGYVREVAQQEGWVAIPPGTRRSTYQNPEYQAAAPFAKFVLNAIQTADPIDSTLKPKPYKGIQLVGIPEYPSIGNQVGLIISQVLEGKLTVDQALKDSQLLVEKIMLKSGYTSAGLGNSAANFQ